MVFREVADDCSFGRERRLRALGFLVAILLLAFGGNMPSAEVLARGQEFKTSVDPVDKASVYWVGHSLIESKIDTRSGPASLMTMVGDMARSKGLAYALGDHTLWGSSLSALWRGRPHGYDRDASEVIPKREAFEKNPTAYDTLVLTEGLPLEPSIAREFSPYYVRRFYCALKSKKPNARIFMYQSWLNLQANDQHSNFPPRQYFDWRQEMIKQRGVWERIIDAALDPSVTAPGWLSRFGIHGRGDGGCQPKGPIMMIPVGNALIAVLDRVRSNSHAGQLKFADGSLLTIEHFFANPYINWPANWPLSNEASSDDIQSKLESLQLRDPGKPHDDIHASHLGIYFAALVHFATIYRQSPVGLPAPEFVGHDLAKELACIAWKTVVDDPRSGVGGEATCQ